MMNYRNMSKKLIMEIFDPSSIPNKTDLSDRILFFYFVVGPKFFFFEKGGQNGPQKRF